MGGKAVLPVLESLFWNQTFQQWFGHKAIPFRYGIINLELEYGSTPRLLRHFLHVAFLNVIVDRHGFIGGLPKFLKDAQKFAALSVVVRTTVSSIPNCWWMSYSKLAKK